MEKKTLDVRYPDGGIDLGLGSRMRVTYDATREGFDAFVKDLIACGDYGVLQQNEIGENAYLTLTSEEGMLHLYYRNDAQTVRVISDTLEQSVLPMDESEGYERVTDTTLCVTSLDYSHREILDGNGMGYAIILADGRFIVIDGGYSHDAPRLYQFMKDNNHRADGKIVIAAWFLTHGHVDHYGALNEFAEQYGDEVTLETFICNPPRPSMFRHGKQYNPYMLDVLPSVLEKFGEVKRFRPHSGQVIRFCDAEFEFLYTQEDFFPMYFPLMNDASTVFRMKVGGQSVLFMADCENSSSNIICDMYGEDLKCDIMQLNHHCYSGGTVELYELAAPAWSMWCTSQPAFEMRTTGEKYQWIGNAIKSNKYMVDTIGFDHCFVADGPYKLIHFPLRDMSDVTYYGIPEVEA